MSKSKTGAVAVRLFFSSVLWLLFTTSCSSANNPVDAHDHDSGGNAAPQSAALVELGVLQDQGVRIELYGPQQQQTGYTPFQVQLIDSASGEHIHGAQVEIRPLMNMETDTGTMMHGAPSEGPAVHDHDSGTYTNPVVLLMPGSWQLQVAYQAGERTGQVAFAAQVQQGSRLVALTGADQQSYFVALVGPSHPTVGKQDLEVAVFTRESMMRFPPVADLQVEMAPFMPSMNHGSPDNEQPASMDNGHYLGRVNFIMTGDWRLDLVLKRDDEVVVETQFDLIVE